MSNPDLQALATNMLRIKEATNSAVNAIHEENPVLALAYLEVVEASVLAVEEIEERLAN